MSLPQKIYVVHGTTGEYSDRSEWIVTAYTKEADAKHHVIKATEYADAWSARTRQADWDDLGWEEQNRQEKAANPMDPAFSCGYTGTSYCYAEVVLQSKFVAVEAIQ